jgi:hypothetical protein
VDAARRRLRQQRDGLLASMQSEARTAGVSTSEQPRAANLRVPVRLTRGPLDFGLPLSRLSAEDAAWYRGAFPLDGDQRFELVNFIDGRRAVSQIRDALSAEYGPVATAIVAKYLEDLVRVGVVKWK